MSAKAQANALRCLKRKIVRLTKSWQSSGESHLSKTIAIGACIDQFQDILQIKGKALHVWIKEHVGLQKSQGYDCLNLFKHREVLVSAIAWAKENDIPASTSADIIKLLPKWRKRDEIAPDASVGSRKIKLDLTESERQEIVAEHAIWSDALMPSEERDRAELSFLRRASSRRVLPDRLAKLVGLKVPLPQFDEAENKAPSLSSVNSMEATEISMHKDHQNADQSPEAGLDQKSEHSSIFSVSPDKNSKADRGEKMRAAVQSTRAESPIKVHRGSVTGAFRGTYRPLFRDVHSKLRVGEKRSQDGLALILDLHDTGTDINTISERLKDRKLLASPDRVARIIAQVRPTSGARTANAA